MDVGSELRDARERRRLSIEDLSRRTKIKPTILHAIDDNDLAHLPGGIFTRAFVKQYAGEVGLDPADIVQRYEAQFAPEPFVGPVPEPTRVEIDGEIDPQDDSSEPLRLAEARLLVAAAALMLVAGSYVVLHRSQGDTPHERTRAGAAGVVPPPASSRALAPQKAGAPQPVGTSGTAKAAPASVSSARGLQVELRPRSRCWITATADGKRTAFRLLNAGDRVALAASNELVLRVGDAASLDYSVNGSRGRTLGGRAEVVTIRLTPANYREFVAR